MNNKKILILTALPFRKYGNQSLYRFVLMLINNNNKVTVLSSGSDKAGEQALENINMDLLRFLSFSNASIYFIGLLYKTFIRKNKFLVDDQINESCYFSKINSFEVFPPYGVHNTKKMLVSWLRFIFLLLENLLLFVYLVMFKPKTIIKADVIISYEVSYAFCSKLIAAFFCKKYINKYQGTILKSCGQNIKDCILFYPTNYFGINKSDLCIMVNDGTDGDWYCRKRGLINIFFEPHGVMFYDSSSIKEEKFKEIDFKKFVIYNNASAAKWKRPDRVFRFLNLLNKEVLKKIIVVTTYNGYGLSDLKELCKKMNLTENIVFLNNLNQAECNYVLKNSKILLMTNDMSNLGNPVLEAIFYNIPIISIDDNSLFNVLKEEEGAVLITLNENFDKNLATTIEKLVLDYKFYQEKKNQILNNHNVHSLEFQQQKEYKEIIKTLLR